MLDRFNNKEKKSIIVFIVILVLLVVVFGDYLGSLVGNRYKKTISMSEKLNEIGNNYNITVIKILNDKEYTTNISCDEYLCIYSSDLFSNKEIIKYNNKFYYLEGSDDNAFLRETIDEISVIFNERYYNLDIIKSLIEASTKEEDEDNLIELEVSFDKYLDIYNNYYNEENTSSIREDVDIEIKYNSSSIKYIMIDYEDIDFYFNNNYNDLSYKIIINSLNTVSNKDIKDYIDKI